MKVKPKFQVTIPTLVRKTIGLEVGDLLEAEVQANQIVLTPKALVDKELQASLAEASGGKLMGPFHTARAVTRALNKKSE